MSNFTYQHFHGLMLQNLNKQAVELKLTHSEYRVMCVLIGYWNKKHNRAYPCVKELSKVCCMSNSTVLKAINKLNTAGLILILKDSKFKRQNYYISEQKLLSPESNATITISDNPTITTCGNAHDRNKQNKTYRKNSHDYKKNPDQNGIAYTSTYTEKHSEMIQLSDRRPLSEIKKGLLKQAGTIEERKMLKKLIC